MLPEGIVHGELSIEEGRIHEIAVSGLPKADKEVDASDKVVMPGVIDAYARVFDPHSPPREDFRDGGAAAAAGGITTLIVAPLDISLSTPRLMKRAIRRGQEESLIDFSFHAGNMTAGRFGEIPRLSLMGIKSFTASTYGPNRLENEVLREFMVAVKSVDCLASVHAEDSDVLRVQRKRLLKEKRMDPLAHAEWRTDEAEEKAVRRVIELAKETSCNVHLSHLSTRQSVELLRKAKEKRVQVTGGTCPHYLLFTKDSMNELGPYLKVDPALRTSEDCASLWNALSEGVVDIITSDHTPRTRGEKEVGPRGIWDAKAGVPGTETMLALMLGEGVAKGRLTLERLVNALCTRPAQIFGLYPRKGVLREGSDADLVIVDLSKKAKITAEKLHFKVGWTPYEGMVVRGVPTMTISRGVIVAEDGDVVGKPGRGKFIARS